MAGRYLIERHLGEGGLASVYLCEDLRHKREVARGVRIPAPTLARFRIGDSVVMEERADGILLRPRRAARPKLSWEDTARAMANEAENWSAWDEADADGLDQIPWEPAPARSAAEKMRAHPAAPRKPKRLTK